VEHIRQHRVEEIKSSIKRNINTLSKYISKNLFLAASGSNPLTPLTEATPPKKLASPFMFGKRKKQ